jgi:hypothetical protein
MKLRNLIIIAGVLATSLVLTSEAQARGGGGRGASDHGRAIERNRGHTAPPVVVEDEVRGRGHRGPVGRRGGPHPSRGHAFRPGHWTVQTYRVWEPGFYRTEFVPPLYRDIVDQCGITVRICVRQGFERQVWVPGRYVTRTKRVWIPARRIFYR